MEHSKIRVTRNYCKQNNIRYMIKNGSQGINPLFLYSPIEKRFIQVCYDILNLTEDKIKEIIEEHIYITI